MFLHSQNKHSYNKHSHNKRLKFDSSVKKIILNLLFLIISFNCFADTYSIFDYQVKVDSLSEVASGLYKVSYISKDKILSKEDLDKFVLENHFLNISNSEFEILKITKLFTDLLVNNKYELAALLFNSLLKNKSISNANLESLFNGIKENTASLDLFKKIIVNDTLIANRNLVNKVISEKIFEIDPYWLRKNSPSFFYTFFDSLKEATLKLFYEALINQSTDSINNASKSLNAFFGSDFEDTKSALLLYEKIRALLGRELDSVDFKKDYAYFLEVFQHIKSTKNINYFAKEVYIDKIHSLISLAKEKKLYNSSMLFFSLIPYNWRTPTTHKLALVVLNETPASFLFFTKDENLINFFTRLSKDDNEIRVALKSFLERNINWYLGKNEFKDASILLDNLVFLYSTNKRNVPDRIYVNFAKSYLLNGNKYKAKYYLDKTSGFLSPIEYIWFLTHSYYFQIYLLIIAFILIILFVIVRGIRLNSFPSLNIFSISKFIQSFRMKGYGYGLRQKAETDFDKSIGKKRFVSNSIKAEDPRFIEYIRLLAVFELNQNASMKDLKNAYRKRVKKVHPDVSKAEEDAREFVYLTTTYGKIMELNSELF